jgi:tripartite ATP-independent transporter DctP family solute receptor
MKRLCLSYLFVGVVIGALLTTAAFVGILRERSIHEGASVVLKLAHVQDQSHPVHAAMVFMAERVAELSGGTVEIQIFPNGQLGSESECIEQVQRGALAITKTSAAAMEGFVPGMAVFSLPYLFRDNEHYWQVLNGPIGKKMLSAGDGVGIHGLCYYDAGSRSFYTIDRPLRTPEDLHGMKIRVMKSRIAMDMITAMGGAPTPISFGELYTALQQRMVDGAENNPPSFLSSRHYEVAKYLSLDEHTRVPDVVIFSRSIWTRLSPQVQAWIAQAAMESVKFQRNLWQEKTQESLDTLVQEGVQVTSPDVTAFAAASASLLETLAGTPVGVMAEQIKASR